jgi:hypothetical protein
MMIVVVKVVLRTSSLRLRSGIAHSGLAGNSTPDTKTSACGQHAVASRAGVGRFVRYFTGCCQILGGCTARHAMNRFYSRSYGLGIGLWPAKTAGEALKKILNFLAFDELAIFRLWLRV